MSGDGGRAGRFSGGHARDRKSESDRMQSLPVRATIWPRCSPGHPSGSLIQASREFILPIYQPSMSVSPSFIFATCQVGAEPALKTELARVWPDFKFAYSRPGFLTFKVPPVAVVP